MKLISDTILEANQTDNKKYLFQYQQQTFGHYGRTTSSCLDKFFDVSKKNTQAFYKCGNKIRVQHRHTKNISFAQICQLSGMDNFRYKVFFINNYGERLAQQEFWVTAQLNDVEYDHMVMGLYNPDSV